MTKAITPDCIVLLHGFLESPKIWNGFLKTKSIELDVLKLHLPNHRENPIIMDNLEDQADWLHEKIRKQGYENPVLIGHSLGGYLALAYLEKYEENLAGICLVNSSSFSDSEERKQQRDRIIRLSASHKEVFIRMAITNLFTPHGQSIHKLAIEELIQVANKIDIKAIQASLKAMRDRKDRTEVLRNYNGNKIIIYGRQDPIIPFTESLKLISQAQIPAKRLNSGHMSWLEDKEKLKKLFKEFLSF